MSDKPPLLVGIGSPACLKLDQWGYLMERAFGERCYHVGSSIVGKTWRDVDVRMILDEPDWLRIIGRIEKDKSALPTWHVLCTALSVWGTEFTGLPIDFQFQLREHVKPEDWEKPRVPIGMGFYGFDVYTAEDHERAKANHDSRWCDCPHCPGEEMPADSTDQPSHNGSSHA